MDITEESDEVKYVSEKALWYPRQMMAENGIDGIMFEKRTDTLSRVFGVDASNQRIDSVHIRSNMRAPAGPHYHFEPHDRQIPDQSQTPPPRAIRYNRF